MYGAFADAEFFAALRTVALLSIIYSPSSMALSSTMPFTLYPPFMNTFANVYAGIRGNNIIPEENLSQAGMRRTGKKKLRFIANGMALWYNGFIPSAEPKPQTA